ncbi:MAG: extracellular solute-binding protein [Clostridia bacterium]|nr:extracellular solute-binding protein [Clostridia bacterium]
MKTFCKIASVMLALVLMLGVLTACDDSGGTDDPGAEETPDYIYVPSYTTLDLGENINYIQNFCWSNEKLYFIATIQEGTEQVSYPTSSTDIEGNPVVETYDSPIYRTALFSADEDGTNITELPNYTIAEVPEGMQGSANVNSMTVDKDGNIWVSESLYTYTIPEETDDDYMIRDSYSNQYFIRKLDPTGVELASIDLADFQTDSEYFYLQYFTVDRDGNLYFSDGDSNLYVLDNSGNLLFEIEAGENSWINSVVTLADGSVATTSYDDVTQGYVIKRIDVASQGYGESAAAPYNAWNLYPGAGDYDFYYDNGTSVFGYNIESETTDKILTWINCDVDSNNISAITPLTDGRIICFSSDYNNSSVEYELITMTKTPYTEAEQKTTLTFACMYLDWNIRSQIIKFNRANSAYRIEVQDYSEYNTNDDPSAGLTKLTTEIISGKVPDILDTDNLPIRQYAARGMLEDLWPYIDADTELGGRDGLVTPVFDALEQDGKLYQITPSFSIYTVIGASSIVGDEPGWTLDDLYAALEKMPEGAEIFSMYTTKNDILYQCCAMGMDGFVNWSTGECTFDSPEFVNLLKFSDLFPETFDWDSIDWESGDYEDDSTRIMAGKQMLAQFYASDFQYFQMYKAMFGGDVTFIGFPTESESGNAFQLYGGLAMSASCSDKDGAWQFMRTLLTEEYQEENTWEFPTNQNVFDQKLEDAMTPIYYTDPETGEEVEQSQGSWGWGDIVVDMYALSQEEADQFTALIESTDRVYSYDEDIMEIINDETAAFLAGQKSAEDTAAMIQSRVSLYVNEQR